MSGVAARVTRGELGEETHVICVAAGEDSHAIDVRPRIRVAGGDDTLVTLVKEGRIKLPDHVPDLREKAIEMGGVGSSFSTRLATCSDPARARTTATTFAKQRSL